MGESIPGEYVHLVYLYHPGIISVTKTVGIHAGASQRPPHRCSLGGGTRATRRDDPVRVNGPAAARARDGTKPRADFASFSGV
jgi:hypothetical protein